MQDQDQYNITQVSEMLGIKDSTLRKWERDYDLKIPRNEVGYRFYTTKELEIIRQIKHMKDEGANIHVIKRILSKSIDLAEQKEEALNLLTLDRLTGTDLKDIITNHIVELMKEQEEALTMRFQEELAKATEEIRNEVREEFQRQQEQISAENEKLINWLTKTREEDIAAAVPWWKFWQK